MENEVGIPIDSYIKEQFEIKPVDIKTYSPLTLAYIGDGIFDLVIRSIVVGKGNTKASRLHARTSQIVKAHSQAMMAEALEDVLTEEEADVIEEDAMQSPQQWRRIHLCRNIGKLLDLKLCLGICI